MEHKSFIAFYKFPVTKIMEYGNDYHIDMAKRNAQWLFREDC